MAKLKEFARFIVVMAFVLSLITVPSATVLADCNEGIDGTFDILILRDGGWQSQGELSFRDYETLQLPLENDAGQLRLRLVQQGHDAAFVDYVAIQKDDTTYPPVLATNVDSGNDVLCKVLSPEYDVCDAWESILEVFWDNVPENSTFVMRAMEEDLGEGHGAPLYHPCIKLGYTLSHTLVNDGGITVDGLLEESTEPDFSVFWTPSSPHPDGYTYGWLCCDNGYLYAAVEVTADNTPDEEDWGAIYVIVNGELKEFRVSGDETKWGISGFEYTSSVLYKHRIYEFQIPFSEINASIGSEVQYGFGCYGTVTQYEEVWVDNDYCEGCGNDGHTWGYDAFDKINDGVAAVASGGTVHVYPGTYAEPPTVINKSLTLESVSGDWHDTVIDNLIDAEIVIMDPSGPFSGNATISGFTINGGTQGIYIQGMTDTGIVTINNCFIHDNGTGIYGAGTLNGDIFIDDCIITQNGVTSDGICLYDVVGTVEITDSIIGAYWDAETSTSYAGNSGYGICVGRVAENGVVNIDGNKIAENGWDGIEFGAGLAVEGDVTINNNIIGAWTQNDGVSNHRYTGNGHKGINVSYMVASTGSVDITNNKIAENSGIVTNRTGVYINSTSGDTTISGNYVGSWEETILGTPVTYNGNAGPGIMIEHIPDGSLLIEKNNVTGNTEHGIYVADTGEESGAVTIDGNTVGNNNSDGIYLNYADGTYVIDNEIYSNSNAGIYLYHSSNCEIYCNDIYENGNVIPPTGIHLYAGSCNNIINYNNIYDNIGAGVYSEDTGCTNDATNNWWGCPNGPGDIDCDGVFGAGEGYVESDTWLEEECTDCPFIEEPTPTPTPPPGGEAVGGDVYPMNKLILMIPWIALTMVIVAGGILLVRIKTHR